MCVDCASCISIFFCFFSIIYWINARVVSICRHCMRRPSKVKFVSVFCLCFVVCVSERPDWLSVHSLRSVIQETVYNYCLGCSKGMVDKWNVTNVNSKPDMVIQTILFWGLQRMYCSQSNAPNHPNTFTVPESKPIWSLRHEVDFNSSSCNRTQTNITSCRWAALTNLKDI